MFSLSLSLSLSLSSNLSSYAHFTRILRNKLRLVPYLRYDAMVDNNK